MIFQRHRALRWLAPVGVLGVVGLAAGGMITAKASSSDTLPDTTTAELVADMQSTSTKSFSGTVVAQMSLGLPALPAVNGERASSSMAALLSGSHTLRVWFGDSQRQRIALLGPTSETDIFHSGRDVWQWDSDTRVATHYVLKPAATERTSKTPLAPTDSSPTASESVVPSELASQLLAAVDPTTKVSLGANRTVADRSAYDLVLTPRDATTRVGSVHIAVDGSTKLPLAVEVYPRGTSSAAVDVAFSDISFKSPAAGNFQFSPPPGASVSAGDPAAQVQSPMQPAEPAATGHVSTIGSGWSSIVTYSATAAQLRSLAGPTLSALTPVSGAWGSGRLLDSALFSALILTDGRVFVGAVDPQALFAAAASH